MPKLLKPSLKSIVAASVPATPQPHSSVVQLSPPAQESAVKARATLKERAKQMSVYLEPPVYDQLRDIAHTERTKIHTLILEGLDLLFRDRGARSIQDLTEKRGERSA